MYRLNTLLYFVTIGPTSNDSALCRYLIRRDETGPKLVFIASSKWQKGNSGTKIYKALVSCKIGIAWGSPVCICISSLVSESLHLILLMMYRAYASFWRYVKGLSRFTAIFNNLICKSAHFTSLNIFFYFVYFRLPCFH